MHKIYSMIHTMLHHKHHHHGLHSNSMEGHRVMVEMHQLRRIMIMAIDMVMVMVMVEGMMIMVTSMQGGSIMVILHPLAVAQSLLHLPLAHTMLMQVTSGTITIAICMNTLTYQLINVYFCRILIKLTNLL